MSQAAERLLVRIDATAEQLRRELRAAETSTQSFERKTMQATKRVEQAFRRLGSATQQLTRLMGPLAAAFSVAALNRFAQNTLAAADELGKLSTQIGVSTTALQTYSFAADLSGVRTSTLNNSLERLTRRMAEARTGTGQYAAVFEELGISTASTEQAFRDTADAIANASDEAEAARIAYQVFGREGLSLVRMLRDGTAGLDAFASQAERLGLVLREEDIRRAERFNDRMTILRRIFTTQMQSTILQHVGDDLSELTRELGRFMIRLADMVDAADQFSGEIGMGIIGRILFGRRGMFIGAAIGAVISEFNDLRRALGIGLSEAEQAAENLRNELRKLEAAQDALAEVQRGGSANPFADQTTEIARLDAAIARHEENIERYRQQVGESAEAQGEFNRIMRDATSITGIASQVLRNVGQGFVEASNSAAVTRQRVSDLDQEFGGLTETVTETDDALRDLLARFEALRRSLEPALTPIERYAAGIALVAEASAAGAISTEQLRETVELLKAQFADATKNAETFESEWTSAVDQIDAAFQQFLMNGLRDFDDFGKQLVRIAQQVAAQIVSNFVRAQIAGQMAAAGTGAAGAAGGAASSAMGGAASAGMFGLSAGATAGIAVVGMLAISAIQRRQQRRRQEREERASLEAREREIEMMIRTVGQLDDLTEQRQRELDKLRPANREIQERIFRLEDELRVARERQSLEERAFRLMGNTTALREIELRQTEEANRGLLRFIFALEDAADRVARAEQKVRMALAGVERAVQAENDRLRELQREITDRQREAETELLDRIRMIDSALATMRSRRQQVDPLQELARARATIAIAQTGGINAVERDALEDALQIVASPAEDLYVSFEEYMRDFLRTKRVLEDIQREANAQHSEIKTEAEKQLEALQAQIDKNDEILEEQRRAVNALFGIDDSVRSVEDAVKNLEGAMREFSAASRAQAGLVAGGIPRPPAAPGAPPAAPLPDPRQNQVIRNLIDLGHVDRNRVLNFMGATEAQFQAILRGEMAIPGRFTMSNFNLGSGTIGGFADGGLHTGGIRMVGERGPELEVTGPSRIMSNEDLMSALRGDHLVGEIRSLKAEVASLRGDQRQTQMQIVRHTKRTREVLENWNVEGLPEERVT